MNLATFQGTHRLTTTNAPRVASAQQVTERWATHGHTGRERTSISARRGDSPRETVGPAVKQRGVFVTNVTDKRPQCRIGGQLPELHQQ